VLMFCIRYPFKVRTDVQACGLVRIEPDSFSD